MTSHSVKLFCPLRLTQTDTHTHTQPGCLLHHSAAIHTAIPKLRHANDTKTLVQRETMEDVASAPVLAGPSQPTFSRPSGSERRNRKSGTANIFQGVNLRQLKRLFQAAGDPDAEQRARMVWGNRRAAAGEDGAEGEEEAADGAMAEVETGLAQALVGLRVRARTRSGLRVDSHKDTTGTRWVRAFGHLRINEGSLGQTSEVITGEDNDDNADGNDDSSTLGACGGQGSSEAGPCDQGDFLSPEEEPQGPSGGPRWSWNGVQEKDPERYLHRIRH